MLTPVLCCLSGSLWFFSFLPPDGSLNPWTLCLTTIQDIQSNNGEYIGSVPQRLRRLDLDGCPCLFYSRFFSDKEDQFPGSSTTGTLSFGKTIMDGMRTVHDYPFNIREEVSKSLYLNSRLEGGVGVRDTVVYHHETEWTGHHNHPD